MTQDEHTKELVGRPRQLHGPVLFRAGYGTSAVTPGNNSPTKIKARVTQNAADAKPQFLFRPWRYQHVVCGGRPGIELELFRLYKHK